jgi:hypothetical protein
VSLLSESSILFCPPLPPPPPPPTTTPLFPVGLQELHLHSGIWGNSKTTTKIAGEGKETKRLHLWKVREFDAPVLLHTIIHGPSNLRLLLKISSFDIMAEVYSDEPSPLLDESASASHKRSISCSLIMCNHPHQATTCGVHGSEDSPGISTSHRSPSCLTAPCIVVAEHHEHSGHDRSSLPAVELPHELPVDICSSGERPPPLLILIRRVHRIAWRSYTHDERHQSINSAASVASLRYPECKVEGFALTCSDTSTLQAHR